MLQDLIPIPHQWLGLPVFGFGWFLIAWAIASVILLAFLYLRYGLSSETTGYLPVLLVMGVVIAFVLPHLEQRSALGHLEGLTIRGYGVMLLLAVVCGVGLAARQSHRMGLDVDLIYSLAFWLFIGGIVGARAFYVIQYRGEFQQADLLARIGAIINVTQGGLVVYGSFIGASLAGIAFLVRRKLPALAIADLVTPSLLLGLAIGRIGCLLNGCCFGGLCDTPWLGVSFPDTSPVYKQQRVLGLLHGFHLAEAPDSGTPVITEVLPKTPAESAGLKPGMTVLAIEGTRTGTLGAAMHALSVAQPDVIVDTDQGRFTVGLSSYPTRARPVHPTQVYSTINAGLLSLMFWAYYPFRRRDGELFASLLIIYPITRILLEIIRTDEGGKFGTGLTISQIVSLSLVAAGIALWCYLLSKPQGSVLPVSASI